MAERPAAPETSTSGAATSRCTWRRWHAVRQLPAHRKARWTIPAPGWRWAKSARRGSATRSYVGASYGYDDTKYGIPVVEEGQISLTPKRHSFSARAGAQNLDGWLQSYRATIGVRRYQHSELEGTEIGTTFHNDTVEGEALLSHRRAGRLVGSFGGWFLNRAFEADWRRGAVAARRSTAAAAFLYEEIESPHATLQFGGRFDHTSYAPEGGLLARDVQRGVSGPVGLLLKPQAANDNVVVALNVARAARYPALEELYYLGPAPREPRVRGRQRRTRCGARARASTSRCVAADTASRVK